jgi:hypothetical protein
MKISVTTKLLDLTPVARRRFDEASRLAMDAAANVYEREVKRAHSDHYTTQEYRGTLNVRQSIRRTAPAKTAKGWAVDVGTKLPQPLYWEMGWETSTGRTMRRRIWVPTLIAQTQAIRAAYARVVKRMMNK